MFRIITLLGLLATIPVVCAQDDVGKKHLALLEATVAETSADLVKDPDSIRLLSRRGDARLFLGRFKEAVADFEKMIAIDPAQDAPHWRLGIAFYFAGDFAKSAKQFEKYHAYDGHDRENGIWKFLAQAKTPGQTLDQARHDMLVYTKFDREPFPSLYEMFAGRKTGADVFAEIEKKDLGKDPAVMFFANYYVGLNEDLIGHRDKAAGYLKKAASSEWGRKAEGGPSYMYQVACLHLAELQKEPAGTR